MDNEKFLIVGILMLVLFESSDGYSMENYCNKEFNFITKDEDQIQLSLNDNYIYGQTFMYLSNIKLTCEATFAAWISRYPKFMFYFENIDLDCDKGHLEFYTGRNTDSRISGLEGNICGVDKPQGVFTVDSRYFRIKYVPKRSQYVSGIFSMVITTYNDGSCPSYAHKCGNSRCINEELACNGYDSCGDDTGCNLTVAAIIGIVVGSTVALVLIISVIICCTCCMRRKRNTQGSVQTTTTPSVIYTASGHQAYNQQMYGVSQGFPYNTGQSPNPVPPSTGFITTDVGQQGYIHQAYGFNQGTTYSNPVCPNNSPDTGMNQQQTDTKL